MQVICIIKDCGKPISPDELVGEMRGVCFACRRKKQPGEKCKKNGAHELTLEEQHEGMKGICSECRAELADRKLQINKNVVRGRAKETCNVCRACGGKVSGEGKVLVGGSYAHAIIPQSLIKKSDLIILRFLTIVYTAAFRRGLNADTLDISPAIESVCQRVEEMVCSFQPGDRRELDVFYRDMTRLMETAISDLICPSQNPSAGAGVFCLPQRFVQLDSVSGLVHIMEVIGKGSLERFGIGKQCKKCEDFQGDDCLIMRHDRVRLLADRPPTFVGNKCLEMIGDNTVRRFVWNWLRTDSAELGPCVLNEIFKNLKNPETAATKVLTKLKEVFKCYYSLLMIAYAEEIPLHTEGLDELLAVIQPSLPQIKLSSGKEDRQDDDGDQDNSLSSFFDQNQID